MNYDTEFERIYERANYAKVEDNIVALERSLEGDPRDIGYGIARNTAAYGSIDDVQRLEDQIKTVGNELRAISTGVSDYETTLRKNSPKGLSTQRHVNYRDMTSCPAGADSVATRKILRYSLDRD